jgi:hypothetical protein
MANDAPDLGGRFIEAGHGFLDILLGSRALRWMLPETILGDVASWRQLYLTAKPSHVGVDVDGLACPCTILWSVAVRRGDMASCSTLPCPIVVQWAVVQSPGLGYLMEG